jgi:uncharacterized membrane protein YccF (DUF307 family)
MGPLRLLLNVIGLVFGHVLTAIAQACTIVGIPLAIANLKVIPVTLAPLGKEIVPSDRPFVSAHGAYPRGR